MDEGNKIGEDQEIEVNEKGILIVSNFDYIEMRKICNKYEVKEITNEVTIKMRSIFFII